MRVIDRQMSNRPVGDSPQTCYELQSTSELAMLRIRPCVEQDRKSHLETRLVTQQATVLVHSCSSPLCIYINLFQGRGRA